MSPYVYLLYMLILKQGMTPQDIYLACKNKTSNIPRSIIAGPFGSETRPMMRPQSVMRIGLYRILKRAGLNGTLSPISFAILHDSEVYRMTVSLAGFISKHATEKINLTRWDRFKRWLK